jgi:hypothetical protein
MKKEKNTSTEEPEGKPQKKEKSAKVKKSKKQAENIRLPFLLELTYTLSAIILLLLALTIMITSLLAGASIFTIVLRTGVAVVVVGGVLMLIASQISSGLLFSVKLDLEEEQRKEDEGLSMNSEELSKAEAS